MKVLDMAPFQEGLQRNLAMLERLRTEMKMIEESIKGLIALEDSLKGEGGKAIRSFYEECHLPFLLYFDKTIENLALRLRTMRVALNTLEPNSGGHINEEFLEVDVEAGLTEIAQLTEMLTDDANSIMAQVNDIVSLPRLDDSDVHEGVQRAKARRTETLQQLNEFDAEQTQALGSVETDIGIMENWLADLDGLFNGGLTDVNFPAADWAAYTSTSPLNIALEADEAGVEKVTEGKTPEQVESGVNAKKTGLEKALVATNLLQAGIPGAQSSFALFMAGRKDGLSISFDKKGGTYRVNATEKAFTYLQIEPNEHDKKAFNQKKVNKGIVKKHWTKEAKSSYQRKAPLNYATNSKQGWSLSGEAAIKNFPELELWAKQGKPIDKAKSVGKATLKGMGNSFKEIVNVKGIFKTKNLKGIGKALNPIGKALGPLGAGLSYAVNYEDAKQAGLSGTAAVKAATVDTAIDTAVAGAVQAGSVAFFTVAIPFPGVGTAVGVLIGIGLNNVLNKELKKLKKLKNNNE